MQTLKKTKHPEMSTKESSINCIENLLMSGDISIDKYELFRSIVESLDCDSKIHLGDGIYIRLTDELEQ